MKTHKVRPVLVETKEKSRICHLTTKGKEFNDLRFLDIEVPVILDSINYELILISLEDEEIKVGEIGLDLRDNTLFEVKRILTNHYESGILSFQKSYCKKVIARQSQIPLEYISKFIEQYNKGYVEDLEIEMEELYFHGSGYYKAEQLSPVAQEKYDFMKELKPKLTNGFVTIVEKELKYNFSFDEARLVIDQFICEECPSYSQKGNGGTYLHKFMKERNIKLSKETISYTEEEVKNMLGLFGKHIMTHSDLEFGEEFEEAAIWLKSIKKK